MKRILIFRKGYPAPTWWMDYVKTIGILPSIPQIQSALQEYGGKFVVTRNVENGKTFIADRYIEFEDESGTSMFLLKWHREPQ